MQRSALNYNTRQFYFIFFFLTDLPFFFLFFSLVSSCLHRLLQCSSGCGSGYTTRNVTCTNGRIESPNECTDARPIKYKQCENKSHCRWRYGKWKNCTCAGYQKRRITCWDGHKNKAATNCPDEDKPHSRQRCNAPPNCKYFTFLILFYDCLRYLRDK